MNVVVIIKFYSSYSPGDVGEGGGGGGEEKKSNQTNTGRKTASRFVGYSSIFDGYFLQLEEEKSWKRLSHHWCQLVEKLRLHPLSLSAQQGTESKRNETCRSRGATSTPPIACFRIRVTV